jgi:hypothetical protein
MITSKTSAVVATVPVIEADVKIDTKNKKAKQQSVLVSSFILRLYYRVIILISFSRVCLFLYIIYYILYYRTGV